MSAIFRGLLTRRTYVSALFIATRLPLGFFYFAVLLLGLAGGLSGALILVGVPAIVLTFVLAHGFAAFERHLARWWLGVDIAPMSPPRPPGRPFLTRVRDHLASAVTWKSILYLLLQFPAAIVVVPLEVIALSVTLAATLAPVWYLLDRLTYHHPAGVQLQGLLLLATGSGAGVDARGLLVALLLAAAGVVLLGWVLWALDQAAAGWGAVASRLLGISDAQVRLAEARSAAAAERERAERADQSQRELIVNVSHELRTPIASIRAHVESLTMREGVPLDPEVVRYLDVVARETERLSALVDDLLAVARAEAGELQLTVGPVSAVQLVRHVHEALGPMARRQRRVTLLERVPDGGLPLVLADPDRLTQVMMNLVRNAVTYTPEGGLVSIEATADGPAHVILAVADTGIGIAPEDLGRVFERFYRTDASRARSTGGFGLGLSIARDLVQAMGGTITVESEVGAGSRFTVRLPVATVAAEVC